MYAFGSRKQPETDIESVQNAFSARLSQYGFNLFRMLVVDVMHVVELGVWKALFIQLLRLLEAVLKGSMNVLDARWASCKLDPSEGLLILVSQVSEHANVWERHHSSVHQ